jgi:hypothetical protein
LFQFNSKWENARGRNISKEEQEEEEEEELYLNALSFRMDDEINTRGEIISPKYKAHPQTIISSSKLGSMFRITGFLDFFHRPVF